jgi:hypothetical protein
MCDAAAGAGQRQVCPARGQVPCSVARDPSTYSSQRKARPQRRKRTHPAGLPRAPRTGSAKPSDWQLLERAKLRKTGPAFRFDGGGCLARLRSPPVPVPLASPSASSSSLSTSPSSSPAKEGVDRAGPAALGAVPCAHAHAESVPLSIYYLHAVGTGTWALTNMVQMRANK